MIFLFKPVTGKIGKQDAHRHINGQINIQYLTDRNWTRCTHTGDKDYMASIISALPEAFDSNRYLLARNNYVAAPEDKLCTTLSIKSLGMNCYSHIDNIAYLAATNPDTQFINALKARYGFTNKDIFETFVLPDAYQVVCRTSLRKPQVKATRNIIVGSRVLAEALHELFPQSTLSQLVGFEKQDKREVAIPLSCKDRKKKSRIMKAVESGKQLSAKLRRNAIELAETYPQCQHLLQLVDNQQAA
ncbi:hypothetical protein [Aliikangiella sp. G2MR2-5]|uniref:hypothetical protein n=1 Tax=Aliikangiella sp. G2MR2-5 TaxID=2788943 RepID=UPI0018A9D786|nr:hypothetical protein [Aliikangiella sp. G2MR2-5]